MDQNDDGGIPRSVVDGQVTAPDGSTQRVAQPDMLAFANQQLASGTTPDVAIQATLDKYHNQATQGFALALSPDGKSFRDEGLPVDSSGGIPREAVLPAPALAQGKTFSKEDVKPLGTGKGYDASSTPDARLQALKNLGKDVVDTGGDYAKHATESIANLFGTAASYFKNFHAQHETIEPGAITPQEDVAAKLMGISANQSMNILPGQGGGTLDHGQIYKLTPEQRQELTDKTLSAWGLTPKEERERVEASMRGDYSNLDVVGGVAQQSLMANMAERILNPQLANTKKYYALQDTVKAMDTVAHPTSHTAQEVQDAQQRINDLKSKLDTSTWSQVKDMWKQAVAAPGTTAKQLAYGFAIDPELALLPEAKVGTLLKGGAETAAMKAAQAASATSNLAKSVGTAAANAPEVAQAAEKTASVYGRVAERAQQAAAQAKTGRVIGNVAGSIGSGAALNAGISAAQQLSEQGYVDRGSIGPAAITGAALGAVGAGIGHLTEGAKIDRPVKDTNKPGVQEPGQPLPNNTPIEHKGTVPYYGGVSADGKTVHLDENAPASVQVKNKNGQTVTIPSKETVAWHEAVEYPLMHLTGPVPEDQLALIKDRMGPYDYFETGVEEKLKKGESLSYAEAHDIATRSENHLVETLFNVHPDDYQNALKPYIKKVGEASKVAKASDIPVDLDTKPYDNMGYPEQLKGAGARPDLDKGQRGAADKRLVATGTISPTKSQHNFAEPKLPAAPYDMTPEEVYSHGRAVASYGEALEDSILGDKADAWRKALRQQESSNPVRADKGAATVAEIEESLHPADVEALYGSGGNAEAFDPLEDYHQAHSAAMAQSPGEAAEELSRFLVSLGGTQGTNPASWPRNAQVAYAGMRTLAQRIHDMGWNSKDIQDRALRRAASRFSDPNDAEFMLDRFLNRKPSTAAKNVPALQQGKVDPRLLATGVVTGAGAVIGAAAAGPDNRTAGAVVGGLAGLGLSAAHWGEMKPTRGFGKQEAGTFAGPLSSTWKGTDVEMAKRMEKVGKTPEQIHLATGLVKVAGGKWAKEFSDRDMSIVPSDHPNWERAKREPIPLSTVLNHTELDKAYPGLTDDLKVVVNPDPGFLGAYNPTSGTIFLGEPTQLEALSKRTFESPKSILAHEVQHAIQQLEGFPRGSNSDLEKSHLTKASDYLSDRFDSVYDKIQKAEASGNTAELAKLEEQYERIQKALRIRSGKALDKGASDLYNRSAGEVQSRNVQTRLDFSEEERATNSPYDTQDYPNRLQVVRPQDKPFPFPGHQRGAVDPDTLKKLGTAAGLSLVGGSLGIYYGDKKSPLGDFGKGAVVGLALTAVPWKRIFGDITPRDAIARRDTVNTNALFADQEGTQKAALRMGLQRATVVAKLAGRREGDVRIGKALDTGNTTKLSPKERQGYDIAKKLFDTIGQGAMAAGVLRDMVSHYLPHIWEDSPKAKAYFEQVRQQITSNMSPNTRHALQRTLMSIEQGKKAGLVPKTERASELMAIYANSVGRAMANKGLIEGLRKFPLDMKGNMAVMPSRLAPHDYVTVNHPLMENYRAAPDVGQSMDYLFHTYSPNAALTALQATNALAKRSILALSLFHPMSLMQAHVMANPLYAMPRSILEAAQSVVGKSKAHDMYMKGMQGDDMDGLLRNGLEVSPPGSNMANLHQQTDMANQALDNARNFMDSIIPHSGIVPEGMKRLLQANDYLIWHGAHFGMKSLTALHSYAKLKTEWAKVVDKNPNAVVPSQDELYRRAASFANDAFGGLNLRRLADDATTHIGRQIALSTGRPGAQRFLNLAMLAPDWKMSTLRTFTQAIGKQSLSTKTLADLHRQYIVRGAILYFIAFNALNRMNTGRNIWENEDPMMLDNGDGTKTQLSKHFMEMPSLVHDPAKFMLGSLSPVVSEAFEQWLGKDYLTTSGGPPMRGSKLVHAAKKFVPIPFTTSGQTIAQRAKGWVGFPTYQISGGKKKDPYSHTVEDQSERVQKYQDRMNNLFTGGK